MTVAYPRPKKNGGADGPAASIPETGILVDEVSVYRAVGRRYRECTVAADVVLRVELRGHLLRAEESLRRRSPHQARRDGVDANAAGCQLLRQPAREGVDGCLGRHVRQRPAAAAGMTYDRTHVDDRAATGTKHPGKRGAADMLGRRVDDLPVDLIAYDQ